jgi:hypothetical protein
MKLLIRIIYGNIDYLQQFIILNKKIESCLADVIKLYVLPFKKQEDYSIQINPTILNQSI